MKFFTLEAYNKAYYEDGHDPEKYRAAHEAYDARLAELKSQAPSPVWDVADPELVDDGLLVRVRYDRAKRRMHLTLRCGDVQIGYFDLDFRYQNVEISPESEFALATVARATRTCIRYWGYDCYRHELDMADDDRFEHRFLFHHGLLVRCSSMEWERVSRPDRTLPRSKDRFPGGPPTPPPSWPR